MGAITDLDQLVNTLTGGTGAREQCWFFIDNRVGTAAGHTTVAGQYTSMWRFNGMQGAAPVPPTSPENPTRASIGALGQTNATGGRTKYIAGVMAQSNVAATFQVYDRLAHVSGLSGTVTTAQSTSGLAASRHTGADSFGNQAWVEIYTQVGTTATTLTINYTNQDGVSGQVSKPVVFGGTGRREVSRMIFIPLADNDRGVRSVESVTLLASTGTAGDFGITLVRPKVNTPIGLAGAGTAVDCLTQMPSLPSIEDDAALAVLMFASTSTSPHYFGTISFLEA